MRGRGWVMVGVFGLAIIFGVVGRNTSLFAPNGGTLLHRIHWMRYGYDRVWYHNRDYVGPSKEMTFAQLNQLYGQGQTFLPTGDKVIGLPVYDTSRSLPFQKQHQVVSTLLFLKKPDGKFIVYSLSGGP
ncbi:hypothetical protein [Alicyclobacillus ferrooxydans]|uniref:Uncharacterized protein n=1 Tax=Alicyclobacillus ferrooxydans TaxID=471514 RepID=A0A0P9CSD8_9BACL|nr:hypothetical protein [Alicyclobacillus ferrooxydans]KPV42538.1 hypothetical protein AN477_16995 [Alicyclobacillus ferrooxydans]